MLKQALAVLIVTATPALAADGVMSSHEVRFDQVSFNCGEIAQAGKVVRFIHSNPGAKYIPEFQPAADDPLAKSWDIAYRIICEGGYRESNITAHAGRKGSVR
ncbi:MAG: hypothetical protein WAN43_04230 [Rhodomicrobium sp.]|jgi:hypothetical protein